MKRFWTVLIAAGLAASPGYAGDIGQIAERLHVGKTNIFCIQAVCPWRGVVRADDVSAGPSSLLWSSRNLPRVQASPEDAQRVAFAWNRDECLAVDGAFIDGVLYLERIVGACP